MSWNPSQYLKFTEQRLRPAMDLLAHIALEAPQTVYDLGCGAGNVTRILAERWPEASIIGVDDSATMLENARKEQASISWQQQSIAEWAPTHPADLIYSNAALHWLPGHSTLFPKLMNSLAPGGVLAVQMPRNFAAPSHTLIADTVRAGEWQSRLAHLLVAAPVSNPDFYYSLIAPDAKSIDIWETEYLQVLHGKDPVKEWTKGTWLKQFLDALEPSERPAFEEDYAQRLRVAYPAQANGETLFPFRRLFMIAQKK
ncbi:MAG: methyltransferase domain-containing protein [Betaproteobacteria bacterium]